MSGIPFVGRSRALTDLVASVAGGTNVVLRGPPGIGKTRLASEALGLAAGSDGGQGAAGDRHVEHLLASVATSGRSLGTLAPVLPAGMADADLAQVYALLLRHWRRTSAPAGPPVVWLDDAHHTDVLSATVLRHAASAGSIQLVATQRQAEALPDGLEALVREGVLSAVVVGPLEDSAVLSVARAATGRSLDPEQARRVVELSGGNPLFARELALVVSATDEDAAWRNLDDLVGHQVAGLPAEQRRVLELIAAAEPVHATLLSADGAAVRELIRIGLVLPHGQEHLRVDHPARSAWLLRRLGALASLTYRELLDRAGSDAMSESGVVDPATIVDWSVASGRPPPVEVAVRAARLAVARGQARSGERAVAALPEPIRSLLQGQLLVVSGEVERGLDVLDACRRQGPLPLRVEAACWVARYAGMVTGDVGRAHASLDAVEETALDPPLRRQLWTARAWLWIFWKGPTERELRRLEEQADLPPSDPATYELLVATAAIVGQLRGDGSARPLLDRALTAPQALEPGPPRGRWHAVSAMTTALTGDPCRAASGLSDATRAAVRDGDCETATQLGGNTALLLAMSGRVTDAVAAVEAVRAMPSIEGWLCYRLLMLAVDLGNRCLRDGPEGVDPAIEQQAVCWPQGLSPLSLFELFLARARRLQAGPDTGGESPDRLAAALARMASQGKGMYPALVGADVLDVRDGALAHEVLAGLVGGPGSFTALVARLGRARLERDPDTLQLVASRLEQNAFVPAASRVWADVVRLAPDDERLGHAARRGLVRLRRRWNGASMWWVDDIGGVPSPHQVDVALRVADLGGVAPVARELTLSRRTVENHVYRVTHALGVCGHKGLREALRRPASTSLP